MDPRFWGFEPIWTSVSEASQLSEIVGFKASVPVWDLRVSNLCVAVSPYYSEQSEQRVRARTQGMSVSPPPPGLRLCDCHVTL